MPGFHNPSPAAKELEMDHMEDKENTLEVMSA